MYEKQLMQCFIGKLNFSYGYFLVFEVHVISLHFRMAVIYLQERVLEILNRVCDFGHMREPWLISKICESGSQNSSEISRKSSI